MRRLAISLSAAGLLLAAAACGTSSTPPQAAATTPPPPPATSVLGTQSANPPSPPGGGGGGGGQTTSSSNNSGWPSPEDCISYNPSTITVTYNTSDGSYLVTAGSTIVMQFKALQDDTVAAQAKALAQRYTRHCYIGRANTRTEDRGSYIFDYWRDPSGQNPPIPGEDDICSNYNRNNLTVEDMGGGDGWRVKDHDHVLHLFDNGTDARNGDLVLAKYSNICEFGDSDGGQNDTIDYLK
jgi:hypothetical protein